MCASFFLQSASYQIKKVKRPGQRIHALVHDAATPSSLASAGFPAKLPALLRLTWGALLDSRLPAIAPDRREKPARSRAIRHLGRARFPCFGGLQEYRNRLGRLNISHR